MIETFVAALFGVGVVGTVLSVAILVFVLGTLVGWRGRGDEPCIECGAARR